MTVPGTRQRRPLGRWLFLAAVAGGYAATFAVRPDIASVAASRFADLALTIAPVLLVIFALILLAELFLDRHWVARHLGASGLHGWVLALAGGVLSMGPMIAWYPLLQELRRKGMGTALAAGFLYSRAVKLPLLPLMAYYFGLPYTALLTGLMLAAAVVSGLLTARLVTVPPRPEPDPPHERRQTDANRHRRQ